MTDEDKLFEAFVAGFMRSGEGYNAEHPHAHNEDAIRGALELDFAAWYQREVKND